MKKKCNSSLLARIRWRKTWLTMKFMCLFVLLSVSVSAASYSQNARFTVVLNDASLTEVFSTIRKSGEFTFIYNVDDVRNIRVKSLNMREATIQEILDEALRGTGFVYRIEDHVVVIQSQDTKGKDVAVRVKGWVFDTKNVPLPGVTVRVAGVSLGTATNTRGWFAIDLPIEKGKLEFSFVGYKKKQVDFTKQTDTLRIVMEEDLQEVEEVVVTGIFNKPKESFTGAVTAITKEDIKMNYSRNLLQTLSNIDPSFRIIQNNEAGSNPNVLPEIQLRGASTMLDVSDLELETRRANTSAYNRPLFIMDGFEVELERVMDLNENEVENITILKDASATSLYGARGANGVVIITTSRLTAGKLRVMYEGRINIEIPDLSTYDNLMTAREKFELEKRYGLWDYLDSYLSNGQLVQEVHDEIEEAIASGVNYDWLKVPTRTGVGQTHILRFMGGEDAWTYGIDLSYQSTMGVMKESERKNFNGTINLGYRAGKWNIRQGVSIGINSNQDSPYGRFSSYVAMNRYWRPYDENGKLIDFYYHPNMSWSGGGMENPMYDHEVGKWNKSKYFNVRSNTRILYNIKDGFTAEVNFGINRKEQKSDSYIPPSHRMFQTVTELDQKGSFGRGEVEEMNWELRGILNYSKVFQDKHMLTVGVSAELSETITDNINWGATGFLADNIDHPGMSLGYPGNGRVMGSKSKSRRAGIMASVNYYYDQRYFIDASINYNGSSSFGKNSRFSPYYSFGCGWLISNESFVKENLSFINEMRVRYSVGVAGNMVLAPNQYMEVFTRLQQDTYLDQLCWQLGNFANPDLKQQNTLQHNIGLDLDLFKGRVSVNFNYYTKMTNNVIQSTNLPISHGFNTLVTNVGKIRNEGYDLAVNLRLYDNADRNIKWYVNANFSRLKNTVVKLSEGFKERFFGDGGLFWNMSPNDDMIKYQEGKSLDAIYGLRTQGVNPVSGQRVFLKADGVTTTLEQDTRDIVYLGDRQPKINSTVSTTFAWKGFDMTIGFGIKWGGKQFNQTEMSKGENLSLSTNADRRVLKNGWYEMGDKARYKNLFGGNTTGTWICDDFVHKDNVFSCNNINLRYQFPREWLNRVTGLESLSISTSLSDIFYFSTIKRERGTVYPFSINPNFSISCTF